MIDRHPRWHRPAPKIACLAALVLLFASCSDDPTENNALLAPSRLPAAGSFRDTTIYAVRDSVFRERLPMDGTRDLVGAGAGYNAVSLIQFTPGSFPARDTVGVVSATLTLYLNYRIGPPGGTIAFNVYRLNRQWDPATITWDSLAGIIETSPLRGSYSAAVTADSGDITVPIDTTMVREWLRTSTSTDVTKFGIALVPTTGSGVVIGFQSFSGDSLSRYPLLTIIASGAGGSALDTTKYAGGISTFSGDAPLNADPATLSLQAGVADRAWLSFDVSFLQQSSVVNSAQLLVDRVPSPPFVTRLVDTTLEAHLATGTTLTTFEGVSGLLTPLAATPGTLSGDVTHIAQSWTRPSFNFGLVLRTSTAAEFSSFNDIRVNGVRATGPTLRPRMHIEYTVMNLGRRP